MATGVWAELPPPPPPPSTPSTTLQLLLRNKGFVPFPVKLPESLAKESWRLLSPTTEPFPIPQLPLPPTPPSPLPSVMTLFDAAEVVTEEVDAATAAPFWTAWEEEVVARLLEPRLALLLKMITGKGGLRKG